jgi:hypothetical protein
MAKSALQNAAKMTRPTSKTAALKSQACNEACLPSSRAS